MTTFKARLTLLTFLLVCLATAGHADAEQWIVGSVAIRNIEGRHVYGERLAVFLVSQRSPVSAGPCLGETDPQRRLDCINNRHLDFYKHFQEKVGQTGYLVAQTVTSEIGNFAFFGVPAGRYYVLVKFPSMIDGYKVAWQEPVTVATDRISVVTLDDDNLVLPTNRRR